MLEIKNPVVVFGFIFLERNAKCGRLADSNYLHRAVNTVHKFSCTHNICTVWQYVHGIVHTVCDNLFN